MDLKKLRVKVKESAKPRKSSERIVSARRSTSMSDLQLPKMTGTGMGEGLSKGLGGFEMMADLSKTTLMGSSKSVGNDLVGVFYDFSRDNKGNPSGVQAESDGSFKYQSVIKSFLKNNWESSYLEPYYRAPLKLYATQFLIPATPSADAPLRFGIRDEDITLGGALWLAHYKGKFASKTGGTFRFRGAADDFAFVRVNKKVVWKSSWSDRLDPMDPDNWKSSSEENKKYGLANTAVRVGDWFTLKPGVPLEIEAICGEDVGGYFNFVLLVEEQGAEYPKNREGGPILPVFRMAPTPGHLIDEIKYHSVEGDFDLEGGPIFSIY
jgi:hypothetical protein